MSYIVVIPARYKSTRLPAKPLVDIGGKSMLLRTYEQCLKACVADKIYVATDHVEIENFCKLHNIQVIMTSDKCLTGTDRIAEVAEKIKVDTYINVQGDEPVINPKDITKVIEFSARNPSEIINGFAPIKNEHDFNSVNIPKCAVAPNGNLLYMSRAAVPGSKSHDEGFYGWRQICVYGFPYEALKAFAKRDCKTPLEAIEDIEILRFLEMGFTVKMIALSDASIAVDVPEDVNKVLDYLKNYDL